MNIDNLTGKELFEHLYANKRDLINTKKMEMKRADAFFGLSQHIIDPTASKSADGSGAKSKDLSVKSIINTTNWFDSHKDVHLPGIWTKSVKELKNVYLLQEHSMSFKGIISDEVKAYVRTMSWKELGYDYAGRTEALTFDSMVKRARNEYMYEQYRDGNVKNHSVGMRYVSLDLAINDPDYKEEFAIWNKYIDQIANKRDAEDAGYFWPVYEAKVIEGSAVPIGSNVMTPTIEVKEDTGKQPSPDTDDQPLKQSIFSNFKFELQ